MERRFYDAVRNNRLDQLKSLLTPSLDVNWVFHELEGNSPLHSGSWNDHVEVTSALLLHPDIAINQLNDKGCTPFLVACREGAARTVKLLLQDSRVEVNLADSAGCTPVWWAAYRGHRHIIKWLLASGRPLDVDVKGDSGGRKYSVLEIAKRESETEILTLVERWKTEQDVVVKALRSELEVKGVGLPLVF